MDHWHFSYLRADPTEYFDSIPITTLASTEIQRLLSTQDDDLS